MTEGSEASLRRCHAMLKSMLFCLAMLTAASANVGAVPARYDFHSIIPQDWRGVPPPHGMNAEGFVSPRGEAWLVFKAEPASRSVHAQLALLRTVRGGHVTYEREGGTWIVVSGLKGKRIFYRKAVLACGGRVWHFLEFEYPAAEKRDFDDFVTRASKALGAYSASGCKR